MAHREYLFTTKEGCCGLNCVSQEDTLTSSSPEPVKMSFFGNIASLQM